MDILNIILNWAVCAFSLCGIYLWLRRYEGDISRRYLCLTWMFASVMFFIRLLSDNFFLNSSTYYVLPVSNLIGGIMYIIILYLYPVRVINDVWFGKKYRNNVLIPGLSLIVILFIISPYCRDLTSFRDFWLHIGEFNVILRLIILLLGILPFTVMLLYIPYNYTKSGAYHRWILSYSIKIQLIGALYIIFMLTGSSIVSGIHVLVNIYLCASVTYYELFVRFNVSKEIRWRNPDLNLIELASMLNTNRSYLSKAIQEAGYKNYSDMINRRRISEFVEMAKNGKIDNVQDAFFSVGFRSRETALRSFKKYIGVLPTDYLRNNVSASEM